MKNSMIFTKIHFTFGLLALSLFPSSTFADICQVGDPDQRIRIEDVTQGQGSEARVVRQVSYCFRSTPQSAATCTSLIPAGMTLTRSALNARTAERRSQVILDHLAVVAHAAAPGAEMIGGAIAAPPVAIFGMVHWLVGAGWALINYNETNSPRFYRLVNHYYPTRALSLVMSSRPRDCSWGYGPWGAWGGQTQADVTPNELELLAAEFRQALQSLH